jgi:hypothetical protein
MRVPIICCAQTMWVSQSDGRQVSFQARCYSVGALVVLVHNFGFFQLQSKVTCHTSWAKYFKNMVQLPMHEWVYLIVLVAQSIYLNMIFLSDSHFFLRNDLIDSKNNFLFILPYCTFVSFTLMEIGEVVSSDSETTKRLWELHHWIALHEAFFIYGTMCSVTLPSYFANRFRMIIIFQVPCWVQLKCGKEGSRREHHEHL